MSLTIRSATAEDLPAVLPMVAQTCAFHQRIAPAKYPFRPEPEKGYTRWLASQISQPRSVFLVADLDQRLQRLESQLVPLPPPENPS